MIQSKRRSNTDKGFTLIEIVLVLVLLFIISIVTTMVVSTSGTFGTAPLTTETDGLKASLRYAQIQSLNENASPLNASANWGWGINFASDGTSYTLYKNWSAATDTNGNPIMIPVKNQGLFSDPDTALCPKNCHKMNSKVTITSGSGTTVTFDKWGIPIDGSGIALLANIEIMLTQGTETNTITITKNTGFIP